MPLHVQIVSQEGPVFEEQAADMVILPGSEGEMGILPHHTALLTTLNFGELRVRKGQAEESFIVYGGVAEVRPDRVIVLADTAESTYDLDEAKAADAIRHAGQLMKEGLPPDRYAVTAQTLRRAEVQENVLRRMKSRGPTVRIRTIEDEENTKR